MTVGPLESSTATPDFDLHGLAGIRLAGAAPADVRAVARQLGPIQAALEREPDIVIRFVDRLETGQKLRYLGVADAGFTDDAFLVLRSKHKARARVSIPFADIGRRPEIVCERGLPAVPLLIPIVNLTVLANGALPLHASAFVHEGVGAVATGWSKGGKTEALLAFVARGATYVGDEWVYVTDADRRVHGIPEPIRLWDWHLRQLPELHGRVKGGDRARLRALRTALALGKRLPARGGIAPVRAYRSAVPLLERQLYVDVEPERLFEDAPRMQAARLDRLFFVASHESPETSARTIDAEEVAQRMVFSLAFERLDFMGYYLRFRFAFPGTTNDLVERAPDLEREALARLLAGTQTYEVAHPYPVSLDALYGTMAPLF